MKALFLLLSTLFTLSSFASGGSCGGVHKLTLLHTNDHHGHFWKNAKGELGLAARKTLIDSIRKEVKSDGGEVLLLSGGDINTGTPESDLQNAEPDFKGMSLLKYDAMAVGNHEFDKKPEVLKKQQEWSNFPFLSANIFNKKTKENAFTPYIVKQMHGFKVGIVGFTTTDTPLKTSRENTKHLEFRDPVLVAPAIIKTLKKDKKVDLVIAVSHMGHFENGVSGQEAPGDVTLARSVKGFDIIVGGHSQKALFKPDVQNGTYILQAEEWGKYVGRMDIEISHGQFKVVKYELIPVNLKKDDVFITEEIVEDKKMIDFLTPFRAKGAEQLGVKVGHTTFKLEGDRGVVRAQQTNLGHLIGTAFKESVNADIAVVTSGGIRASIATGDVSYRDVLTVLPFGNTVVSVEISGAELKEYLEAAYKNLPGSGGFPQVIGATGMIQDGKISGMMINGSLLDESKMYKLTTSSFTAQGGDGYLALNGKPSFYDTKNTGASILRKYIEENKIISLNPEAVVNPFTVVNSK